MSTRNQSDSNLPCILAISQLFTNIRESISIHKDPCLPGTELAVQHIVFKNKAKFLLLEVVKRRLNVENMFHDREYPIWTDRQASRDLEESITTYRDTFSKVLCTMAQLLNSLQQVVRMVIGRGIEEGERKSLNHPIPEQCLELLEKLRICNDTFCTLVRQVISERSGRTPRASLSYTGEAYLLHGDVQAAITSNSHLFCIQRASQRLHEALTAAPPCYESSKHRISICLDPESLEGLSPVRNTAIRFNLALTTALSNDATLLVVEAGKADFCSCHTDESFMPLDRLKPSSSPHAFGRKSQTNCSESHNFEFMTPLVQCLVAARFECFSDCQVRNASTLDDVLAQARAQQLEIPVEERFQIALHLASGVLSLHSTPWLPSGWSSKNIHVLQDGLIVDGSPALGLPFFCTYTTPGMMEDSVSTTGSTDLSSPFSDLGIVLLEIAFSAPIHELQPFGDMISPSDSNIRSLTVTCLRETVSRKLGSRYSRVVQKCFSQIPSHQGSHSLEQPVMDYIFNDIVKELGQCLTNVTGELNRKTTLVLDLKR